MDTPTIAKYYREKEPMERLKLLEQSIAAEEDPEGNRIRKEQELRFQILRYKKCEEGYQ